jgi:hypothetical protein
MSARSNSDARRKRGILFALIVGCILSAAGLAPAGDQRKAALDLRAKYAADLEQLAAWCEANGLREEARKTRRVRGPSDPYKLYVPILPSEVTAPKLAPDAPAKVVEWTARLDRLRHDHAVALYEIARRAARAGRASIAFEMALAAIQASPDYEPVRRLFGYQKFHDQWRSAYEVKKLRAGLVWSEKFGWLPKAYLRRYEEGHRWCDGRWITAAEDTERHHDIESGWDIETEHYTIRTNHSLEAGVALGVKLERLYRLWREMFICYWASEADVIAMFDGRARPPSRPLPRHSVVFFRDRDDYNRALRVAMPNISISIVGLYLDRMRRAYFFADQQNDDRTLYHEATHQLFHESRPVAPDVGVKANFWIVEGIAMYMESLRQEEGFYVLGGFDDKRFDDDRLHAARYRLLVDKFYVPFQPFCGYGMASLQSDPRIATLYSQAAGQANFLVHYDGGRYRDALVSYLVAVYTGRDDPDTLAKLTSCRYSDLDKQYHEFMEAGSTKDTKDTKKR